MENYFETTARLPGELFKILEEAELIQYSINQVEGAFLNGSLVEKKNSIQGDTRKDGTNGTVIGSIDPPHNVTTTYGYFVVFEDSEEPRFITGERISLIREPKPSKYHLTLEKLQMLPFGFVFAFGTFCDYPDDINIAGTGKTLHWVAKKGRINDWAIYAQYPHWNEKIDPAMFDQTTINLKEQERIEYERYPLLKTELNGNKINSEYNIKKLVPCDDESFEIYRF